MPVEAVGGDGQAQAARQQQADQDAARAEEARAERRAEQDAQAQQRAQQANNGEVDVTA